MRFIKLFVIVAVLLAAGIAVIADDYAIKDGDTVGFLGDSITAARTYGKLIENYTLLRYPNRRVRFINLGIGGDTAEGGLARLERDVFSRSVTVLTVAYGINDIGWGTRADDAHKELYLNSISEIARRCKERGVRVYVCSAAITGSDPAKSENDYLQTMCDEGMKRARENGGQSIDVQRTMRAIQKRLWKANESVEEASKKESLHHPDGVHLNDLGQTAMGYAILKGLGAPAVVSSVALDAKELAILAHDGCKVSDVVRTQEGLEFTREDDGLPLNCETFFALRFRFIPIRDELNKYLLQVKSLPDGDYELIVDGRKVSTYSSNRLEQGINISSDTSDPWQPGGPWDAQGNILFSVTESRDKLDLSANLAKHHFPKQSSLESFLNHVQKTNADLENIQRLIAKPKPYRFAIKRVDRTDASKALPRIAVAIDQKGFILEKQEQRFTPWGFNYDRDKDGRLIEDYWKTEWEKIERDFRSMKKLGANVVRVHLQLGKFMESAKQPNKDALGQLRKLVTLAEDVGLYLDLTGLGCYHKADVPDWYDKLDEGDRWDVQAKFWESVAATCEESPAIFCYDLMNEPVVQGGKREDGSWLGPGFAGKHFVQLICIDQKDRPRPEIARQWVKQLTNAIRTKDKRHLITVGLVDWSLDRPGLTSGFVPEAIVADLDFLCVHLYPEKGKLDDAMSTLKGFSVGKPVIIEETFPLKCSMDEFRQFIEGSRKHSAGLIGFFWGQMPDELRKSHEIGDLMTLGWLEVFEQNSKAGQ